MFINKMHKTLPASIKGLLKQYLVKNLLPFIPLLPLVSVCNIGIGAFTSLFVHLLFVSNQKQILLHAVLPQKFTAYIPAYWLNTPTSFWVLVLVLVTVFILLLLANISLSTVLGYKMEANGYKLAYKIRENLFAQIYDTPSHILAQLPLEDIAQRITNQTGLIQSLSNKGVISGTRDLTILVGLLLFMFYYSPVFMSSLCIFALFLLLFLRFINKKKRHYNTLSFAFQNTLVSRVINIYTHALYILGLGTQHFELHKQNHTNSQFLHTMEQSIWYRTIASPFLQWASLMLLTFAFYYKMDHQTFNPHFASLAVLLGLSYKYIKNLSSVAGQWEDVQNALDQLVIVCDQIRVDAMENLKIHSKPTPQIHIDKRHECAISAQQLAYENIINCIDLRVGYHTHTALTGESGSGKTTLLKLLSGFYQAHSGRIDCSTPVLYIDQTPLLFQGSVWDNIVYSLTAEEIQLPWVASWCVEHMVELGLGETPADGVAWLAKPVLFQGKNLSGGEKARVAFLRGWLRHCITPGILLLDEPTANLDELTSSKLWGLLKKKQAIQPFTLIATTHKPQEWVHFTHRIHMAEGRIDFQQTLREPC
jgi:ABC-type bacteriocin/lantibiotic exporter with double-glycine peptidase domain